MSIPRSLRFKVFDRDGFTCQYCGKKPPDVILEADHMVSKKDGGQDDEINLITACFNCNRGKSKNSVTPEKLKKISFKNEIKDIEEKRNQLEAYYKFLKKQRTLEDFELSIYNDRWEYGSDGRHSLTKKGLSSIKRLLETGNLQEDILKAIEISWSIDYVEDDEKFKYMCGILKRMKLDRKYNSVDIQDI